MMTAGKSTTAAQPSAFNRSKSEFVISGLDRNKNIGMQNYYDKQRRRIKVSCLMFHWLRAQVKPWSLVKYCCHCQRNFLNHYYRDHIWTWPFYFILQSLEGSMSSVDARHMEQPRGRWKYHHLTANYWVSTAQHLIVSLLQSLSRK